MTDDDDSPLTANEASPAFLIGIAGCPSSGKTTLANTLAEVFAPFVNEQAEAKPTASLQPDRVAVVHQDEYCLPTDQCPRASFRPRLPQDENVVAGEIQGDGRVVTADADCLEAVDWELLGNDVEGFLKGEREMTMRPAGPQSGPNQLLEGEDPYKPQRDAIEACATAQMLKNAEGGFEGKYFRGVDGSCPMLGRRLVIVEGSLLFAENTKRQSRKSEAIDASQGVRPSQSPLSDSQGRESGTYEGVTGAAGEQPCEAKPDPSDQRATSIWKKAMRCIKSSLQPPKVPRDDQHHTNEHAEDDQDFHGSDDTRDQPRTNSWTLRGLGRRVQRGAFFARGSKRRRRQESSESDEGIPPDLVDDEQFTVSEPDDPDDPPELELEENWDDVDSDAQPAGGPGRDDQVPVNQPGSVHHDGRAYCDKSTCRFCKGKGVEGRDEQSPCRAPNAPGDRVRDVGGDVTGSRQGGEGKTARKRVRYMDQLVEPEPGDLFQPNAGQNISQEILGGGGGGQVYAQVYAEVKPGDPDLHQPPMTPRDEMLQRMDGRLFLASRKSTAAARRFCQGAYVDEPRGRRRRGQVWKTRGYFEDVEWRSYSEHHGPDCGAGGLRGGVGEGAGGHGDVRFLMTDDVGVEEVVAWAVGEILRLMVGLEEDYRMGR